MAYADFEFYTTSYFGNVVPETDFHRLAERASERIDSMTYNRLARWRPKRKMDVIRIGKACCAITETLYLSEKLAESAMEGVEREDGQSRVVSAVTSLNETIHFATGSVSTSSLEGLAVQQMIKDGEKRAMGYLSNVMYKDNGYNILFRGAGYE